MIKPEYYTTNGKDLIQLFKDGLLTADEFRGFCKGNIYKYTFRYQRKNGLEDLDKVSTYTDILNKFETELAQHKQPMTQQGGEAAQVSSSKQVTK